MGTHIPRPPGAAPPQLTARPGVDRFAEPIERQPTSNAQPQQRRVSHARLLFLATRLHALGERATYCVLNEIVRRIDATLAVLSRGLCGGWIARASVILLLARFAAVPDVVEVLAVAILIWGQIR